MTEDLQEARLQEVLDVIHAARIPLPHAGDLAQNMRRVVRCQTQLERSLTGLRKELEEAVTTLKGLPEEGEPLQSARAQMLDHFQQDLEQLTGAHQGIQQGMAALYAPHYKLL